MVRAASFCFLILLISSCGGSQYSREVDRDQDGTPDFTEYLQANDTLVTNSASPDETVLGQEVLKKYSSSGYKETDWFTVQPGDTLAVAWQSRAGTFYLSVCDRRVAPRDPELRRVPPEQRGSRECEGRARQNRAGVGRFYVGERGRHYFKVRANGD